MAETAVDHAVRWFGLRFASERTEREYREWRIATATPFARIGYIGSMPSWCLLLVSVVVLDWESVPTAGPPIFGWILALAVLTALTFPGAARPWVMPLAAVANCAAGFLVIWLMFDVLASDLPAQSRAGLMTAGMLIVMFFGFAIFRIPPLLAMAAVTPYTIFASLHLYEDHQDGNLDDVEAGGLAAAQWIAYLGCLLVCIVIEIVNRRGFCKDQIIRVQQAELQRSRDAIRRYVPPKVAERIVRGDTVSIEEPVRRRITVLFADLVNFTILADRVEAEVLTTVVNEYMTTMSEIVADLHGTVTEFAGDGLLALFGAPDELDPVDQAVAAVRAAKSMQRRIPSLNEGWLRLGVGEPLAMRVGINTGVLSVGSFGSRGRMTYTAIGIQANIAARIQSQCEPGGILLSDTCWHLVKDQVPCELRGEVECKGVHYPVRVHAPLTLTPVMS